jgi:hypothetical protein
VIFDKGCLPLVLDTPVLNCKSAVLVLVHHGYFILVPRYPPYLVSIPLSAIRGGAQWKTSNSSPGRRKRGRPKLIWTEGIRGLMGEKGLLEEDWKDRSNWRKKII